MWFVTAEVEHICNALFGEVTRIAGPMGGASRHSDDVALRKLAAGVPRYGIAKRDLAALAT